MADLSDVENVLVSTITQTLYPNGTAAASAIGTPCKIFRGWPIPANLDADLKAGYVDISIYPLDIEQNTTRYLLAWQELPQTPPELTLTVSGSSVTVGGTPSSPLNAAVLVTLPSSPQQQAFVHPVQPTDTLASIATALAALINAVTPATSSGAALTVPAAIGLIVRVGEVGAVIQEISRQNRSLRITLWCPTPALRDAVGSLVDAALKALTFLSLSDGTGGRLRYVRSPVSDRAENELLYRRDLFFSVEYATTLVQNAAAIVAQTTAISGGLDSQNPLVTTLTV